MATGFYKNAKVFPRWLAGLHSDYEAVLQRFLRGGDWDYRTFKSIAIDFGLVYVHNCAIGKGKLASENYEFVTSVLLQTSKNYWLDYPLRNVRSSDEKAQERFFNGSRDGYEFDETKMTMMRVKAILGGFYLSFFMYEGRIKRARKSENIPILIDERDVETMDFLRTFFAKMADDNPEFQKLKIEYNRSMLYLVWDKAFQPVMDAEMRGIEPHFQMYQRYIKSKVTGLLFEELEVKQDLVAVENCVRKLIVLTQAYDSVKATLQYHFTYSLSSYFHGFNWQWHPSGSSLLALPPNVMELTGNEMVVYIPAATEAQNCDPGSDGHSLLALPSTEIEVTGNELVVYNRADAEASIARSVANGYFGYDTYRRSARILNSVSYSLRLMERPVMTVANVSSNIYAYRQAVQRAKKRFGIGSNSVAASLSGTRRGIRRSGRGKGNVWKYMKRMHPPTQPPVQLALTEPPPSLDELHVSDNQLENGTNKPSKLLRTDNRRGRGRPRGRAAGVSRSLRGGGASRGKCRPPIPMEEPGLDDLESLLGQPSRGGKVTVSVRGRGRPPGQATGRELGLAGAVKGRGRPPGQATGRELGLAGAVKGRGRPSGQATGRELGLAGAVKGRGRPPGQATGRELGLAGAVKGRGRPSGQATGRELGLAGAVKERGQPRKRRAGVNASSPSGLGVQSTGRPVKQTRKPVHVDEGAPRRRGRPPGRCQVDSGNGSGMERRCRSSS